MLKRLILVSTCCLTAMAIAQSDIRRDYPTDMRVTKSQKSHNPVGYESLESLINELEQRELERSSKTDSAVESTNAFEPKTGVALYDLTCKTCHEAGLVGAPKTDDKKAWAKRIKQGKSVLYRHAIEGYQGEPGMMPAKGRNANISNELIKQAVDYMLTQSS